MIIQSRYKSNMSTITLEYKNHIVSPYQNHIDVLKNACYRISSKSLNVYEQGKLSQNNSNVITEV